ncbi:MAG: hypothetical protein ACRETC_01275 [Gammaproteobacteria bacterium]
MTYVAFIALFGSSIAMAASGVDHTSVLTSFGVSALLALPLFLFNILVHRIIQSIQPGIGSVGIKQLLFSIVVFTAIEAALILPIINLVVSRRLLARHLEPTHDNLQLPP